ncbi:unnamed protein product [Mortierella alpina]
MLHKPTHQSINDHLTWRPFTTSSNTISSLCKTHLTVHIQHHASTENKIIDKITLTSTALGLPHNTKKYVCPDGVFILATHSRPPPTPPSTSGRAVTSSS